MSIKQSSKMEFNDIANVGATHRTHCDCNPLHRHVHKCAYASATGTMSAWYKTCITFSIKTNWTASRGRRCGIIAADDDDDTALPVDDVAAAAAARRDGTAAVVVVVHGEIHYFQIVLL